MIPTTGYILPLWGLNYQYRATALAYMKRENVVFVENINGERYSIHQIEEQIIG